MLGLDLLTGVNEVLALIIVVIDSENVRSVVFPFRPLLPLNGDGPPFVLRPPPGFGPVAAVRVPAPESLLLFIPLDLGSCSFSIIVRLCCYEASFSHSISFRSVDGSATGSVVEWLISRSQGVNVCSLIRGI